MICMDDDVFATTYMVERVREVQICMAWKLESPLMLVGKWKEKQSNCR